jgi:hypothetical protein
MTTHCLVHGRHCHKYAADHHRENVRVALVAASAALASAIKGGRRTDCLRLAVEALQGAWRNVEYERQSSQQLALTAPVRRPSRAEKLAWARGAVAACKGGGR